MRNRKSDKTATLDKRLGEITKANKELGSALRDIELAKSSVKNLGQLIEDLRENKIRTQRKGRGFKR